MRWPALSATIGGFSLSHLPSMRYGKRPAATRYSADMSKHYLFGHATLGKTSRQKAEDRRFAKAIVQN